MNLTFCNINTQPSTSARGRFQFNFLTTSKPLVMKASIVKTVALIAFVACFAKANAQSDLLALNTVPTSNAADFLSSDEKVAIGNFKRIVNTEANSPVVTVKCENAVTMKVRVFTLNGDLAKEETHTLGNGTNDLTIDMNDLNQGVYMVQFYSSEGSAVRRFVKNN